MKMLLSATAAIAVGAAAAFAPDTMPVEDGWTPSPAEVRSLCRAYGLLAYEAAVQRDAGAEPHAVMRGMQGTDDPLWLDRAMAIVSTVFVNAGMRPADLAYAVEITCVEDGGW